jgi:hypothetical protein
MLSEVNEEFRRYAYSHDVSSKQKRYERHRTSAGTRSDPCEEFC